jgi:Plasmid recombination enzyme
VRLQAARCSPLVDWDVRNFMTHNNSVCARHGKGKAGDFVPATRHAFRTQKTLNANPQLLRSNLVASTETEWQFVTFNPDDPKQKCFFEDDFLSRKVQSRITELGIKCIRSDATLFEQLHHSISPEELRDGSDLNPLNPAKVEAQNRAILKSLRARHGDNLICVVIHNDEANPHSISFVVPAVKRKIQRRGRRKKNAQKEPTEAQEGWALCAKELFSPAQCSAEQDRFTVACRREGLNVIRGVKGSRTTHQKMRAHLSLIHGETPAVQPIQLLNPLEGVEGFMQSKQGYFEEAQADIAEKIQRANEQLETYAAKAIERDREVAQRKGYQATAADKSVKLEIARQEIAQLKEQVLLANQKIKEMSEQVRDIPLISVAESVGLEPKEPGIFQSQVGTIRVHEKGFTNESNGAKGRNAIDFTRHLLECDFSIAVRWLATHFPHQAGGAIRIRAQQWVEATEDAAKARGPITPEEAIMVIANPTEANWLPLQKRLSSEFGMDKELLDQLHNDKLVAATIHGNLACTLFAPDVPHAGTPSGVVIFSQDNPTEPLQRVGEMFAVFSIPSSQHVQEAETVLTSNPFEAMAYRSLMPDSGRVISPVENLHFNSIVTSLAKARKKVLLALTDREEEDVKAIMACALHAFGSSARSMVDLLVTTVRPIFKTWGKDSLMFKSPANYVLTRGEGKNRGPQILKRQ